MGRTFQYLVFGLQVSEIDAFRGGRHSFDLSINMCKHEQTAVVATLQIMISVAMNRWLAL